MKLLIGILACGCLLEVSAQTNISTDSKRKVDITTSPILAKLPARNIGPAIRILNSRISSIAVYEKDPHIFFVGSASGGVLKTEDGGKSFKFIFDKEGASSIGAIAVSQTDPNLIWVGPGEGWHRNDAGWGDGIYKTTDGGKTWKNVGLPNSNSFGKIIIDPTNNNIVFAAVLGSEWAYGPDRGVYRTIDGGKNWKKVLYVDDKTGAADIAVDPKNPKNLLAAMWDHLRQPYHFRVGGPGSGIYRSTDGGNTWHKVTKGLPATEMGRISVDYFRKDPRYVAATIEAKAPATGFYRSMNGGETWVEMPAVLLDKDGKPDPTREQWGRPFYDNLVRYDPQDVNRIYHGNPWHLTTDGGKTFVGWASDDHALWIDPSNTKHILYGGDASVYETWDGAKSGEALALPPLGQFYGIGYDMRKPYWVMGGMQDEGSYMLPTQTNRGGVLAVDAESLIFDDGGKSIADPNDWTTVYSLGRGDSVERLDIRQQTSRGIGPHSGLVNDVLAGNAYTDPADYENYLASKPRLRASYTAPFIISPWNSKTLYFGANYLFKSVDRGDHWKIISPDLTNDKMEWQIPNPTYYRVPGRSGAEIYQTVRMISESPVKQGMIWVGTDDGNVQLTMDDGEHWTNLTKNIPGRPEYTWVSHIYASRYSEGRAYATFDGHRNGDLSTYVYVTEDYGKTWTKINGNLPEKESCYVVKEGLKNPDLLFLGTEFSLWVSLDRGKTWSRYRNWELDKDNKGYFPTVAVYDLEIHPRELDLIIGTHGRGIWTIPIRALEELTAENRQKEVYFVSPGNVYLLPNAGILRQYLEKQPGGFSPNTQPGALFYYHLRHDSQSEAQIAITDASGQETYASLTGPAKAGLNVVAWPKRDQRLGIVGSFPIHRPGDYSVTLIIDGKEYNRTLHVEDVSDNDLLTAPPRTYRENEIYRPPTK
jgi:photosystem II stability/assembly factor-like uncharacterized protein